jgi:uncharacterized membrane protein
MKRITKLLLGLNIVVCLGIWGISCFYYPKLPDRVPIHFGSSGKPNRWGKKSPLILVLPFFLSSCFCIGSIIAHYHVKRIIKKTQSTEKNDKEREKKERKYILRAINFSVCFFLANIMVGYTEIETKMVALGYTEKLNNYIAHGIAIGMVIIAVLLSIVETKYKSKNEKSIGWGRFG